MSSLSIMTHGVTSIRAQSNAGGSPSLTIKYADRNGDECTFTLFPEDLGAYGQTRRIAAAINAAVAEPEPEQRSAAE